MSETISAVEQKCLQDRFGRQIEYLRLSVTDRCNLRCSYCLPEDFRDFQEPKYWLSFNQIERLLTAFSSLGLQRVRLTGGEPLLRKNLPQLATRLSAIAGINDLSLSTNAVGLERQAAALYQAGVRRINVSLDSLQPERYKQITRGRLDKVLSGLVEAKRVGFSPIKINMVLMQHSNVDEVGAMVEFCVDHGFTLRFIETMPMAAPGRDATTDYVDLQAIKHQLTKRFDLMPSLMPGGGPARYFKIAGSDHQIGFITPISQHFCETCNRVRLSADGTLYLCLGQEHSYSFRSLLRDNASQAELEQAIKQAIELKPERHEFVERPKKIDRFMSQTGG